MTDSLAASYALCRDLHRTYGRTYYLATRLLPAWKRPYVHALYGFTRYTDDIVDRLERAGAVTDRTAALHWWTARFTAALDGVPVHHPVLPAVLDTIAVFRLDRADFTAFLRSMELDLSVTEYATYDAVGLARSRMGMRNSVVDLGATPARVSWFVIARSSGCGNSCAAGTDCHR